MQWVFPLYSLLERAELGPHAVLPLLGDPARHISSPAEPLSPHPYNGFITGYFVGGLRLGREMVGVSFQALPCPFS